VSAPWPGAGTSVAAGVAEAAGAVRAGAEAAGPLVSLAAVDGGASAA
jgi:hypothetical protein